jgi:PEP-CTERM motif
MKTILPAFAVLTLVMVNAGTVAGGDITYDVVNNPSLQNGFTVTGTITTDGTIGDFLTQNNVVSYDLTVLQGSTVVFTETPANSEGLPAQFQATTQALTIPISNADEFQFNSTQDNTLVWSNFNGLGNPASYAAFSDTGATLWNSAWTGTNPVFTAASSAVPEPTSVALLAMGAVGLIGHGWFRRRREGQRQEAA